MEKRLCEMCGSHAHSGETTAAFGIYDPALDRLAEAAAAIGKTHAHVGERFSERCGCDVCGGGAGEYLQIWAAVDEAELAAKLYEAVDCSARANANADHRLDTAGWDEAYRATADLAIDGCVGMYGHEIPELRNEQFRVRACATVRAKLRAEGSL